MEYDNLYHYGVKGMRWGVRRTPAQLGHKVTRIKKKKTRTSTESKPKELTTEEKKSKVLESRSAKTLYENRKLFNYDEMNRAFKLLETDKKVRELIIEEPNKVEKFVDSQLIPWANRIKNIAEPVATTVKKLDEISKVLNDDGGNSSGNTAKGGGKDGKSKKDTKASDDKNKGADKSDKSTKTTDKSTDSSSAKTNAKTESESSSGGKTASGSTKTKNTYWDVEYEVYTPSKEAKSTASKYENTSVNLLTSSSETKTFVNNIAGLLDGPKE